MTSTATHQPDDAIVNEAMAAYRRRRAAARAAIIASFKASLFSGIAVVASKCRSRVAGENFSIRKAKGRWLVISTQSRTLNLDLRRITALSIAYDREGGRFTLYADGEEIAVSAKDSSEYLVVERFIRNILPRSGAVVFLRSALLIIGIAFATVMIAGVSAKSGGHGRTLRAGLPEAQRQSSIEAPPGSPEDQAALMRAMRGEPQPNN